MTIAITATENKAFLDYLESHSFKQSLHKLEETIYWINDNLNGRELMENIKEKNNMFRSWIEIEEIDDLNETIRRLEDQIDNE